MAKLPKNYNINGSINKKIIDPSPTTFVLDKRCLFVKFNTNPAPPENEIKKIVPIF